MTNRHLRGLAAQVEAVSISRQIQSLIGKRLAKVEDEIARHLHVPYSPVAEMGAYLAASRGSRHAPDGVDSTAFV